MSDLIDKETTTWKQDTIRELFREEQVANILLISLVRSEPKDVLIWRGDNTRVYTVKSGYKWQITTERPNFQIDYLTTLFTKLRGLQIPSKIKIHMWRIAKDYIPTLYKLRGCNLVANTIYSVCQAAEETVSHLFRDFPFT